MKRIFFVIVALLAAIGLRAQMSGAAISWVETLYDFGDIKEADGTQSVDFVFSNTGNEMLFISEVKSSCGCTVAEYTQEPVAPGRKGFVKVTFDPKKQNGNFEKSITVTTNAKMQPPQVLRISGNVIMAKS